MEGDKPKPGERWTLNFSTKSYRREPLGEAGETVLIISDHAEVMIVQGKRGRFPIRLDNFGVRVPEISEASKVGH